tara:strand:+ start:709 stop:1029 length:321 start_codon:yes stop_codon:yes gene_type:complete
MTDELDDNFQLPDIKEFQQQLLEQRQAISSTTIEGSAGGGAVRVSMQADGTVLDVRITPEVVDRGEIELLEDLVAAAFRDGLRRCGNAQAAAMAKVAPNQAPGNGG